MQPNQERCILFGRETPFISLENRNHRELNMEFKLAISTCPSSQELVDIHTDIGKPQTCHVRVGNRAASSRMFMQLIQVNG